MLTGSTTGGGGTMTGGRWVSVSEAVGLLRLSERSVRRQLADGKLVSRSMNGRREIRIEAEPVTPTGTPDDRLTTGGATGGGTPDTTGGELADALGLAVRLADRRADELRVDADRARRQGRTAWSIAAAVAVLAGLGAVWGVRELAVLRGRAEAADAARAVLAEQADRERARADRLERLADQRRAAPIQTGGGQLAVWLGIRPITLDP